MRRTLGCLALLLAASLAPASAEAEGNEPPPRWDVGEICSGGGPSNAFDRTCPRRESENRRSLLLRWQAIPAEDRRACKVEVTQSGNLSYQHLLRCLEARQLKALDDVPYPNADEADAH